MKFVMIDNMCQLSNETEDWIKINVNYGNYTYDIGYVSKELHCEGEDPHFYTRDQWYLTENGTVINGELYVLNNYCIDRTENVAIQGLPY